MELPALQANDSDTAQQQMHMRQSYAHHYLPNDSLLLQHYADMDMCQGAVGGLRSMLQGGDPDVTPTATFDMDRGLGGETVDLVLPNFPRDMAPSSS